jgi:ClpP class serine protease
VQVALGRGLSLEAVKKAAGGRVYTGSQAIAAKLVDEQGQYCLIVLPWEMHLLFTTEKVLVLP